MVKLNDSWWFALMSEMINNKYILNFPIHNSIRDIFFSNRQLIFFI